MATFLLTLLVTLLAVAGLSLGLVFRGRPLQGGCSPKECVCRESSDGGQPLPGQVCRRTSASTP